MKKRISITLVLLVGFLIFWNNYYSTSSMKGTFVSNNTGPIMEGPKSVDTLKLYEDGTFQNNSWGKGTYLINGDEIHFRYSYELGTARYTSSLNRKFLIGSPRIKLNSDLGFYYEKIK